MPHFFSINPEKLQNDGFNTAYFLESAWEALEGKCLGYDSETERLIGVYAGGRASTYLLYSLFLSSAEGIN